MSLKYQIRIFFLDFWKIIKENPSFRLLWISTLISLTGDWLNEIACLTILNKLTDSGLLSSLFLITRDIPAFLLSPIIGVVIDNVDRKKIMLFSDLGRSIIVIGFIFTDSQVVGLILIFILSFMQFSLTSFFNPAQESIIPSLIQKNEIVTANTLMGLTWSSMLMIGAAFGGLITFMFGTTIDFLLDSITYLFSAFCIWRLTKLNFKNFDISPLQSKSTEYEQEKKKSFWQNYKDGMKYLANNRYFFAITLAKGCGSLIWSSSEVAIIRVSGSIFKIGNDASLSLSILYLASGLGVSLAPLFTKRFVPDNEKWNRWMIVFGFVNRN